MVSGHHGLAVGQTDHRLVRHQDFLHQFLLVGITATAIAQIVLRTGSHTLAQVALLQTANEGHTHHCRQIAVLTVRLLQAVERRRATHVDHRRQRQHTTHLPHRRARLTGFQLSQFGVKRTGLTNLLRIDRRTASVDARQHLLVEQGRDAARRMCHQPLLHGGNPVAQHVRVYRLLTGILREMSDTVRYQLLAFHGVQLALFVKQVVHIAAAQLRNALLLRHPLVELVNFLFHILVQFRLAGGHHHRCSSQYQVSNFHRYYVLPAKLQNILQPPRPIM